MSRVNKSKGVLIGVFIGLGLFIRFWGVVVFWIYLECYLLKNFFVSIWMKELMWWN